MKILNKIIFAACSAAFLGQSLFAQELLRAPVATDRSPVIKINLRPLECAALFEPKTVRNMKPFSDERSDGLKLEVAGDAAIRSFVGDWHHGLNESLPSHLRGGNIYQGLSRRVFMDIVGGDIYSRTKSEYDVSFGVYSATLTIYTNTTTHKMERAELILTKP